MGEEKENGTFKRVQQLMQQTMSERILLLKMEIADDLSRLLNLLVVGLISGFLMLMFLLFLSVTAGEYLTTQLQSRVAGYGIVAGFYLLIVLLMIFVFRKPIGQKIDSAILDALFNKPPDPQDDAQLHGNGAASVAIKEEIQSEML